MAQAIVNLALPVITSKIEEVLDTYPVLPHQKVFSSAALREKLITYVVRRVPTLYTTTETAKDCLSTMPINCFSGEQHTQMDRLIHQGIQHLLTQQQTWETAPQNASLSGHLMPSNWFG
ncbi:MAG: hypothetical protein AAFY20_04415 [Cyanobacteria bacterium J06639_14]